MKQSGCGIASLVLGIVGICLSCIFIGIIPSIIGLVLAIVGLCDKNKGHGMAIAGLVCSIVGMAIFGVALLVNDDDIGSTQTVVESTQVESIDSTKTEIKEESVVWKGKKCTVKIIECNNNSMKLQINNGSSKDYNFDIHAMAINGVMTGCSTYTSSTDVPSEKKGIMDVEFSKDWVNGDVEYIDLIIWAYDNAENFKDFDTGIIRIETNKYTKDKSYKPTSDVKEEKGLSIVKNKMDNSCISYSVVNNNDYMVETTLENCSINGWAFDPDYSVDFENNSLVASIDGYGVIIFPECIANVSVGISDFIEENNIESVKDFEFSLNIMPNEDYEKEENTKKIVFENE